MQSRQIAVPADEVRVARKRHDEWSLGGAESQPGWRAEPTSTTWEASIPARTSSSGVSDSAIPSALNRATPWSNAFCTDRPNASAP